MWTRIFFYADKKRCFFKNIRICVDEALKPAKIFHPSYFVRSSKCVGGRHSRAIRAVTFIFSFFFYRTLNIYFTDFCTNVMKKKGKGSRIILDVMMICFHVLYPLLSLAPKKTLKLGSSH